jgi:hypothetical protein
MHACNTGQGHIAAAAPAHHAGVLDLSTRNTQPPPSHTLHLSRSFSKGGLWEYDPTSLLAIIQAPQCCAGGPRRQLLPPCLLPVEQCASGLGGAPPLVCPAVCAICTTTPSPGPYPGELPYVPQSTHPCAFRS